MKRRRRIVHFTDGKDCFIYRIWPGRDTFQRACWCYQEAEECIGKDWPIKQPLSGLLEKLKARHKGMLMVVSFDDGPKAEESIDQAPRA